MPPKAAKRGSAKKPNTPGAGKKTEQAGLIKAPFEEDSWKACVSLVVEGSPKEEELIQALTLAVQQPQCKLFSLITWDSTLAKIHELGNPKTKKTGDTPMYYEVTEPAKVLLDAGEEIPCDLMAKILKFQLLHIKTNDQQRRGGEQLLLKGKGNAAQEPSKEKKTQLKRRGEVELPVCIDDEPDCGPQHYVLLLGFYQPHLIRVLDAMGVHIANVIKLCSEHFQSFGGQLEQHSCEENEQSLRVFSVSGAEEKVCSSEKLAVKAMKLDLFWSSLRAVLDSGPPDSKLHDVVQLSYTVPDLPIPFPTQDPQAVLELGSQIFGGVAKLIYASLDWRRQHQHYRNNVKLIDIPTVIELDSQPVKRKTVQESQPDQEAKLPRLSVDVDMRHYNNLLELVPPEACSVPLILDSMLEQVVISTEQATTSNVVAETKLLKSSWPDYERVSYMLETFLPVVYREEEKSQMLHGLLTTVQNEEDKKKLLVKFVAKKTLKRSEQPLVFRHHDERALRFRDINEVQGFDPAKVELSMMKMTPVWELIQSVGQQRKSNSCWMPTRKQLQHYCTDDLVSWPEVERLCHQSVFEAMPLTRLDQQGVLVNAARPLGTLEPTQQQTSVIPWDNPTSYAKHQLHNLQNKDPTFLTEDPDNTEHFSGRVCSQLKLSDIQSCRQRSLFDWHYAEHHNATIFPQVLQSASEEYRCLDTFRGSHKSILYIFCHNPMSPQRQSKEFWNVALHTDVKFRKYLEHVADTISNWTIEAESKNANESTMQKGECPAEETLEPVIRKDSLKAWQLEQLRLKEEETTKKSKKENAAKGKQQKEKQEDKKKSKISSAGKKSRPQTADSSAKTPTKSFPANAPPVDENKDLHQTEEPSNSFTGYSMDGKLIHVSGCLQYLFPSDGGQITVENFSFVEGSSYMKVDVKKDGHHFYTHINQAVVDPVKPPPQSQDEKNADPKEDCKVSEPVEMKRVKQGSFSALLDGRIRLSYSFYGPTGELTVSSQETKGGIPEMSIVDPLSSSTHHSNGTDLESLSSKSQTPSSQIKPPESKGCEDQPALPSSLFNSLTMSVPNGLVLQILREDAKGVPPEENGILVRQSYPLYSRGDVWHLQDKSLSKELSRIITSQGTVIRNMRDGSTEVLFADGSVSFSQDSGPVWVSDSEVQDENSHQEAEGKEKEEKSGKETKAQRGCWFTTAPSGERICTVGTTHKQIPTTSLLSYKAADPITHQVMLTREDQVVSVKSPEGSLIVEHADGTRITSIQDTVHTGVKLSELVRLCDYREYAGSSTAKNGKPSVFTGKNVTENSKMSECETEKGDLPTKERVVLVEKEGCATVVMYPECHTAHIFLADGTVITGTNKGEYQVFPSSVGLLQIQRNGKCLYSSDPVVTPSPKGFTPINQSGTYTMSHTDKVACDLTDPDGNHFQVMEDGRIAVVIFSPAPSTLIHDEEELKEEEEDREMSRLCKKYREHCPRLFLVHEDGSGTELLSSCTVEKLLHQVNSDHTIALVKEPLPDTQDEYGITILKPSHQNVWSHWLLGKQNPDITPPNLRNRSWHDFPCGKNIGVTKKKGPHPPFGTDLGRGLTLRESSGGSATQHQPVRSCPKALEIREIQQHRPFTTPLKNTIDSRFKEYIENLIEREQRSEEMKVKEPRTEEEITHASDLLSQILSFTEEDNASQSTDKRLSVDIASLYSQGVGAPAEKSGVSEDTATTDTDSLEDIKCIGNRKDSKWTERLAQHRQAIAEEKTQREALRNKSFVPFFHPENISLFESLQEPQIPDMRKLSMDLPPVPKSDSADTFLKDAPQESTPRPLNPTPSQSKSHPAESGKTPKKRPTNPTPQTAGENNLRGSSEKYKSVQVDVTGKPRQSKVQLPTSILSSKPHTIPNQQFLTVEEPVRRKCRTASLANPRAIVRGFQLLPESVDFGTLQEGTTSTITVVMKNVGVDTCRFHVKQPSPNTGLRVIYKPGPVAAGLQVELQVQLFAMCAAPTGEVEPKKYISQDVVINTERDIFYLPVTATILTERLYEIWLKEHSSAHKKKGSRVIQPSSRSGR